MRDEQDDERNPKHGAQRIERAEEAVAPRTPLPLLSLEGRGGMCQQSLCVPCGARCDEFIPPGREVE